MRFLKHTDRVASTRSPDVEIAGSFPGGIIAAGQLVRIRVVVEFEKRHSLVGRTAVPDLGDGIVVVAVPDPETVGVAERLQERARRVRLGLSGPQRDDRQE